MQDLDVLLLPKQTLTADELKSLGQGIRDWWDAETDANIPAFYDPDPVEDLLDGELPKPFALRAAETGEWSGPVRDLLQQKGESASARLVRLRVTLGTTITTTDEFVHRLKLYVPSDAIEQVIVNGKPITF